MIALDPPVTPERSALMSRIRGKDSKPEMVVRRTVHALGYRYRLHAKGLPGHPDMVFPSMRRIIFVHGCFWHRHFGCRRTTTPRTRAAYWQEKFDRNVARDSAVEADLVRDGWSVLTVWECETFDLPTLISKLDLFLSKVHTSDPPAMSVLAAGGRA